MHLSCCLMREGQIKKLVLKDGSRIAVIGGGPAGSFFTYFALDYARGINKDIQVDIIEPKDFNSTGPSGCNKCGGIVSESLIQMLAGEGIQLPSSIIHRHIESYTLHLDNGKTVIEELSKEQSIASMFRGLGPCGTVKSDHLSFDNFLLDLCRQKGANIIHDTFQSVRKVSGGILVKTKNSVEKKYDLIVGAVGLVEKSLKPFQSICPSYDFPEVTRAYIAEIFLAKELIDKYFGNSMHVFLLNLPKIKFGALIPKGNFVTMVLLGEDIDETVVQSFLSSESVRDSFPPGIDLQNIIPCRCYPLINVGGAKSVFADRVVMIGDSASSKLFKNGLGAAYITGKAAADTAIFHGISECDFQRSYQPVCSALDKDNGYGKLIFSITSIIQKSGMLKKGMLHMVIHEQEKVNRNRRMSSILWDTFTGSAPYKGIFLRSLHPVFMFMFVWHAIVALFIKRND